MPLINKKVFTYGLASQADIRAVDIEFDEYSSTYTVIYLGEELGRIKLNMPGIHFVKNSLVAVSIGKELGVEFSSIKKSLEAFTGVYRRFETKYDNKILVIDDYAHHPTEIKATLAGIRGGWKRRLIAVFQPHLYSRTLDFHTEFGREFLNSDIFICTDVYPAREKPIDGVTGKIVAEAAENFGHKDVIYEPDKNKIPALLNEIKKEDDIIVTLGAGDIWKYGEKFIEQIKIDK